MPHEVYIIKSNQSPREDTENGEFYGGRSGEDVALDIKEAYDRAENNGGQIVAQHIMRKNFTTGTEGSNVEDTLYLVAHFEDKK